MTRAVFLLTHFRKTPKGSRGSLNLLTISEECPVFFLSLSTAERDSETVNLLDDPE
jgi:hypothetical protein